MRPIVDQGGSDDFYSPEFIRFTCAAIPILSTVCAVFGVWVALSQGGCLHGCANDQEGLAATLLLIIWIAGQIVTGVAALADLGYLLVTARSHAVALGFAGAGVLFTAVLVTVALISLWIVA